MCKNMLFILAAVFMWPNESLAITSIFSSSVSNAVTNSWYDLSFSVFSVEHLV
jgi:hypothetical protein